MTQENEMNPLRVSMERPVSRREMLQLIGMGTSTAALLAACSTGGSSGGGSSGTKEFHGAWPYDVPPTGHFNIVVGIVGGILVGDTAGPYLDLVQTPFAYYMWKEKKFTGLLGDSWGFQKDASTYTVKLKSGIKWSDGKPVTSKDAITTFWVMRILHNVIWDYIDKIDAKDDQTFVLHMKKPSTVVERYVLKRNLYSDAQYGQFASQAQALFNGGGDLNSDMGKKLADSLEKFRPPKVIACGPYDFDYNSITQSQLTLVKNKNGYAADKVAFDKVVLYNGETPVITPVVAAKSVDYATHGFPTATERDFAERGFRILRPPTYSGPAIFFNMDKFPEFKDKRVRQAFAYAIDRDQNGTVSLGKSGKGSKLMAGFSDNLVPDWISSADQGKLNKYAHDTNKAEQLLKAAGWSKNGNNWVTKDGKPAKYALSFPAEFADWSAAGGNAVDQLNKFGIQAEAKSVTFTQEPVDVDKGNFELAIQGWGSSTQPHPHFAFQADLFTHNIPIAINNGGRGEGFELQVKGDDKLGAVDLQKVVLDSADGLDEEAQKKNVTTAALAFNELLPIVPLFERYGNNPALEGKRVAKFPADNSPLLANAVYADNFVVLQLMQGDLKPA